MNNRESIPPGLASIAAGRDRIKTDECAHVLNLAPQTLRNQYSKTGQCCGIRPIKVGRLLLWPVSEVAASLQGDAQ